MKTSMICVSVLFLSGAVSCGSKVNVSDMQYPQTRAVVQKRQPVRKPAQIQRRAPVAAPYSESGSTGRTSPLGASSSGRSR